MDDKQKRMMAWVTELARAEGYLNEPDEKGEETITATTAWVIGAYRRAEQEEAEEG